MFSLLVCYAFSQNLMSKNQEQNTFEKLIFYNLLITQSDQNLNIAQKLVNFLIIWYLVYYFVMNGFRAMNS